MQRVTRLIAGFLLVWLIGCDGWRQDKVPAAELHSQASPDTGASEQRNAIVEAELAELDKQGQRMAAAGYTGPALVTYGRALDRVEASANDARRAVLWSRIGDILGTQGDVQSAVIAYESAVRALTQDVRGSDRDPLAVLARRGGKGFGKRNGSLWPADLDVAPPDRQLDNAIKDPLLLSRLLLHEGNAYARQPQLQAALVTYELALQRLPVEKSEPLRAAILANKGALLVRVGDLVAAQEALTAAGNLLTGAPPRDKRRLLASQAELARAQGDLKRADSLYREALPHYSSFDRAGEGRALAGRGWVLLALNQREEAQRAFEKAVRLGTELNDAQLTWSARAGVGQVLFVKGELRRAAESLDIALHELWKFRASLNTDEGRVAVVENAAGLVDNLIEIHFRLGQRDPVALRRALAISEAVRGSVLEELSLSVPWTHVVNDEAPEPQPTYCKDWAQYLQENINVQASLATPTLGAYVNIPRSRWQQRTAASEQQNALELDASQPPSRHHRIVFHVLDRSTIIFTVSPGGHVTGHQAPLGREALAQKVSEFRRSLGLAGVRRGVVFEGVGTGGDTPAYAQLSRELFDTLIAPLRASLPPDDTLLVIEPQDSLWLLPFAALQGPTGHFVGERWPLLWAPSARMLQNAAPPPTTLRSASRAWVFAQENPSTATLEWSGEKLRFGPLSGAKREAGVIASLFPSGVLASEKATVSGVLQTLNQYDVIHFATHGVAFSERPQDSFLLLGRDPECGEFLTARMATGLDLKADLVTLSACETGMGRVTGDGMVGLARAFIVAGARTVVMSQWSVDDQATEKLMTTFYRAYVRGANKPSALREAMAEVRKEPRWASPLYWAPFVLFGAE